jgi:hypothetical protein
MFFSAHPELSEQSSYNYTHVCHNRHMIQNHTVRLQYFASIKFNSFGQRFVFFFIFPLSFLLFSSTTGRQADVNPVQMSTHTHWQSVFSHGAHARIKWQCTATLNIPWIHQDRQQISKAMTWVGAGMGRWKLCRPQCITRLLPTTFTRIAFQHSVGHRNHLTQCSVSQRVGGKCVTTEIGRLQRALLFGIRHGSTCSFNTDTNTVFQS